MTNNKNFALAGCVRRAIQCALILLPLSAQAGVVVIAHPSVQTDALTAEQASQLFSGRALKLPDGSKAQPLSLNEGAAARVEFNDKVLGKNEQQLRSYWSRMIFTGKAQPPRVLNSSAEMVRTVASTPGYVGYVDSKDVTDKVKVLFRAD